MKLLGNILWLIFGGLLSALGWVVAGIFWCITIIGIPFGKLAMAPFGAVID